MVGSQSRRQSLRMTFALRSNDLLHIFMLVMRDATIFKKSPHHHIFQMILPPLLTSIIDLRHITKQLVICQDIMKGYNLTNSSWKFYKLMLTLRVVLWAKNWNVFFDQTPVDFGAILAALKKQF